MAANKDAADQNFDYMFKLLIIGNSSVGKTSFLFRYSDDSFSSSFVSTVGIDFKVKTVFQQDKRIKLQIWVGCLTVSPYISKLLFSKIHRCMRAMNEDQNIRTQTIKKNEKKRKIILQLYDPKSRL